ncbi:MAG TPA: carbon monoxide dehydrogenase subunit G [Gemmatimonadales bacterium]|jgi:carbon monoxide dehydrogenase subunit G
MRLEFAGAPEIMAPREEVWSRLLDPNFVAASAPGVESVEPVSPTHFKVNSGIGVGPLRVSFQLDVKLSDVVPLERLRMTALGSASGSAIDTVSLVRLEPLANGRTRMNWEATSTISGAVASLGPRLLEGAARRLTEDFWTDFVRRVGAGR